MDREALLFAPEQELSALQLPELAGAEEALGRLERSGATQHARRYIEPSLRFLNESLATIFRESPPSRIRFEACEALLRAPLSVWRTLYPGRSLHLTFVDRLREIARDYGIAAEPLSPSRRVVPVEMEGGSAAVRTLSVLRSIFDEYERIMGADTTLERIAQVFGLNSTELGRMFGVARQAVDQWRTRGIPAERRADVDRIRELAELYHREFIPERIPQIVRRPVEPLGGRTVLEALAQSGPAPVREYLARAFAFLAA